MSKVEIIGGSKFIDGYLCNDAGQPITMNNGYSSEEEHEARIAYKQALYYANPRPIEEPKKKRKYKKTGKYNYVAPREDERWH